MRIQIRLRWYWIGNIWPQLLGLFEGKEWDFLPHSCLLACCLHHLKLCQATDRRKFSTTNNILLIIHTFIWLYRYLITKDQLFLPTHLVTKKRGKDASDQVKISCSFFSSWWKCWCQFSWSITKWSKAKPNYVSCITFQTYGKLLFSNVLRKYSKFY